jgi:hypothetical protein
MNGPLLTLTVYNGELIAGGGFDTAGGVSASRIARWNGSVWQPLDTGLNSYVNALADYGGELIAGGQFTAAGTVKANRIARWNGTAWQSLIGGMNSHVRALTVYPFGVAGQLVVGGQFTLADNDVSAFWARFGPICSPGDLDEDGIVGILDFLALLAAWGPCPGTCPPFCAADVDFDCEVGITDFLALLGNWG